MMSDGGKKFSSSRENLLLAWVFPVRAPPPFVSLLGGEMIRKMGKKIWNKGLSLVLVGELVPTTC